MPIVASMGGIAGTQVLTLMVRALALGQVGFSNALPLLRKESPRRASRTGVSGRSSSAAPRTRSIATRGSRSRSARR